MRAKATKPRSDTRSNLVPFRERSPLFWEAVRTLSLPFRDYLYPLVALEPRPRRKAPRLVIRRAATVRLGNVARSRANVLLEDFSATGFAISGDADSVARLLRGKRRGDRFNLTVCLGEKDWILEVELVRRTRLGNTRRAAFGVLSDLTMHDFIADLELFPASHPLLDRLANYWVRRGFRWTATALWIAIIMGLLFVPSLLIRLVRS